MDVPAYDCYQVNLQVKLTEEESCLYNRYGTSLFNVRRVRTKFDDACCTKSQMQSECEQLAEQTECKIPDAVVISIDIDNCDCTKAVFCIFVQLPCKKYLCPPEEREREVKLLFEPVTFMLTSGANGGIEREILTFVINPLPPNVVSTGMVEKCCTYEIIRVPRRKLVKPCPEATTTVVEEPPLEPYTTVTECQCVPEAVAPQNIGGNVIRVMFPLTREIKCLIPDMGLPGALLNCVVNQLRTTVRLVSNGPVKFVLPTVIAVDKETCTVCLDIDLMQIANAILNKCDKQFSINGFENMLGQLGCLLEHKHGNKKHTCCGSSDAEMVLDVIRKFQRTGSSFFAEKFLRILAFGTKRLDVMGLHKCTETVLFSFHICCVPFRSFKVDCCGVKFPTEILPVVSCPEQVEDCKGHDFCCTDYTDTRVFKNSFSVMSDVDEYSYEYVVVPNKKCECPATI